MDYTVSAYFEASKHLAERISEAKWMQYQRAPFYEVQLVKSRMETAANRVSEFVEIFTWETRDTDLIRTAFVEVARNIQQQFTRIIEEGHWPDPFNGTPNRFQLQEDILVALEKALYSNGRHVPRIDVKATAIEWDYSRIERYLSDMQRQLRNATFDNLLEAVTYYERSSVLLQVIFRFLDNEEIWLK